MAIHFEEARNPQPKLKPRNLTIYWIAAVIWQTLPYWRFRLGSEVGWRECWPAHPDREIVSFRSCVRATDARFPILCRFSAKNPSPPPYLLCFVPHSFLFVRDGGPSCSNLDFSPWFVSFSFGDLIFWFLEFLEESSWREFLKRVLEESSWRDSLKKILENSSWREFLKRVLEESSLRELFNRVLEVLEESSWRKFLTRVLDESSWREL